MIYLNHLQGFELQSQDLSILGVLVEPPPVGEEVVVLFHGCGTHQFLCLVLVLLLLSPTGIHRWELLGNYCDFVGVMVFYLSCQRTKRIIVTAIICYNIYIYMQSLISFV